MQRAPTRKIEFTSTPKRYKVSDLNRAVPKQLDDQPKPTSLARAQQTVTAELQRDLYIASTASARTQPESSDIEGLEEESNLSSGSLMQELAEIEARLPQIRYPEALRRLRDLMTRYPQSRLLRAKLQSLELAMSRSTREIVPAPALHESQESTPHSHIKNACLPRMDSSATSSALPTGTSWSHPARHLPPAAAEKQHAASPEAKHSLRTGITMRSFGQHKQAIAMLKQALREPCYGARAALLTGLSLRELNRCQEAIAAFMLGINMPEASEAELTALFYELGYSYELLCDPREAILYYQLVLGAADPGCDAAERIARLQSAILKK